MSNKKKNQWSYSTQDKVEHVRGYYDEKSKNPKLSISAYAKAIGVNRDTLRRWVNEYHVVAAQPDGRLSEGHFIERETAHYKHGELYQTWIKSKRGAKDIMDGIERALSVSMQDVKPLKRISEPKCFLKNSANVLPLADGHIGGFACDKVGDAWNLENAEEYFKKAIKYLIDISPNRQRLYLFNIGDWFHYNINTAITERSGHVLDCDGTPYSMIDSGLEICRFAIAYGLEKHEEVVYDGVSGNHDGILAYALSCMLGESFNNNPRAKIVKNHKSMHVLKYGINLFGLVHGHQTKMTELPIILADDYPELWGETKERVWFMGHYHHDYKLETKGKDLRGCHVKQLRTLAPSDRHAREHGYGSARTLVNYTYNKDYGEQGYNAVNYEMLKAML